MLEVHLRWISSHNPDFPFRYKVPEETTVGEICQMVKDQNNRWPNNPTFSVVKLRDQGVILDDKNLLTDNNMNGHILYLNFLAG